MTRKNGSENSDFEKLSKDVHELTSKLNSILSEDENSSSCDEDDYEWMTEEQIELKHQAEWNDFVWEERKKSLLRDGPIRIWLTSDVDEEMNDTIVKKIRKAADYPERDVEIYISTFGGSVYAAFSICDAILAAPNHVKTIGIGKIMSAGGPILCVGNERVMTENSFLMIHDIVSGHLEGSSAELQAEINHANDLKNCMIKYFEKNSKLKRNQLEKMLKEKKNHYYTANDALKLGIIDYIEEQYVPTESKENSPENKETNPQ